MAGRGGVELAEDGLLDLHLLRHRLDHEVDVAELLVGGGAGDPAHHLGEAGVGLLLGQLLLLDQAGELALGDRARFLDRGVDELLVDVLDDDGDVGGGDRLRDLAAHGAAADDGGLGNEHCGWILRVLAWQCGRRRGSGGYPVRRLASVSDERDRRGARRRGSRADRAGCGPRATSSGPTSAPTGTPPRRSARPSTSPSTRSRRCSASATSASRRGSSTPTPSTSSSRSTATSSPTPRTSDEEWAGSDRGQRPRPRRLHPHRPPRGVSLPEMLPELQPGGTQRAVRRLRRPRRDGRDRLRRAQRDRAGARGAAGAGRRSRQRAGAGGDAAGDQRAADEDAAPARARCAGRFERIGQEIGQVEGLESPTTSAISNASTSSSTG